jgi:hypothetical protein
VGRAPTRSVRKPRAGADDRLHHLARLAELTRDDHSPRSRVRPGRRLPERSQPRDRRLGPDDLPAPVPGDERPLERLLRVHAERPAQGRLAFDRQLPQGLRPRLPPPPRRDDCAAERTSTPARPPGRDARLRGQPVSDAARDLEPTGLRQPEPPRQHGTGLLPRQPLRRRRRQRPLRHRRQGGVGRERPPVQGAPLQAVRDPRVGSVGHRRPRVREAHGRLGEDTPPRGAAVVVPEQGGVDLRPRDEAAQPSGVRRYITPLG